MNTRTFAYIGLVMGTIFVLMGIAVIALPPEQLDDRLASSGIPSYLLGFVVILYGGFRLYRAKRMLDAFNRQQPKSGPTE
jgi:hypothetical protein